MVKYETKFKLEVVESFLAGEGGAKLLARRWSVSEEKIRSWVSRYRVHGVAGLQPKRGSYTAQFKVQVLSHSMGDLAEAVLMPHPTLTKAIDRLIDRSLVYRGHDPGDRRKVAVFLADRGSELLTRVEGGVAEHHRLIEAVYGTERTERLMRDLEGLVTALDDSLPVPERAPGGPGRS